MSMKTFRFAAGIIALSAHNLCALDGQAANRPQPANRIDSASNAVSRALTCYSSRPSLVRAQS